MTLEQIFPRIKDDAAYRRWLSGGPEAALVEAGINVPAKMTAKLLDTTPESIYRMLPTASNDDLANDDLANDELANDDRPDVHSAVEDRRAAG